MEIKQKEFWTCFIIVLIFGRVKWSFLNESILYFFFHFTYFMYEFICLYLYIVVIGASNDGFGSQQIQHEKFRINANLKTADSVLACENKVNCTSQNDAANHYNSKRELTVTSDSSSIFFIIYKYLHNSYNITVLFSLWSK